MLSYYLYIFNYIYIRFLSFFNYIKSTQTQKHKNNIIVSLTTIPSRVPHIINTINSILMQTVLPSKIVIGIPLVSQREPHLKYIFHENILQHKLIDIIQYEEDKGPIMKLLTGLDYADKNTNIITIDDDTIYEEHLIETLITNIDNLHNVYCTIGRDSNNKKSFGSEVKEEKKQLRTLEGYGGVLYKKSVINAEPLLYMLETVSEICKYNDDLLISAYLQKEGINIQLIPYDVKEPINSSFFTKQTNPLWLINEEKGFFNNVAEELNLFTTLSRTFQV